jgi:hypothetical protein
MSAHDDAVRQARGVLLAGADIRMAAGIADTIGDLVGKTLNDIDVGAGTSLVARALIAQGTLAVAAAWWSGDLMPAIPLPVAAEALRSIVTDPPAGIDVQVWLDPDIVAQNKRREG